MARPVLSDSPTNRLPDSPRPPVRWLDVSDLSFNSLLLLERAQIGWFPGWVPEEALAVALRANPAVAWYLRHKCPEIAGWLDGLLARHGGAGDPAAVRAAERAVLATINDLLVYVLDPAVYDAQPFLGWDSRELTAVADFADKTVLDIGAGTGRLTFVAAASARVVFAVEPVANLRAYLREKAGARGVANVYPVDGLITRIPFPDGFADVVMGGHVFGGAPADEYRELARVTRPGGAIVLCPGNVDRDDATHDFLVARGFRWSRFAEPGDGVKRKYWKTR